MGRPILLVLDDEPQSLQAVQEELRRRYGSDYDVLGETSATRALQRLEGLRGEGREIPLVFADHEMAEMQGADFFTRVHEMLPESKRALLVDVWDISCAGILLQALTFGQADDYITKPWGAPDERFHRAVTVLLEEWAQAHRTHFQLVRVVGHRNAVRSYELRDLLQRGGIPSVFYDANSEEGRKLIKGAGLMDPDLPVCFLYNAEVLVNPSNVELDEAIGVSTHPEERFYDLTIVGAGPAGLSAAVYGSSEGLNTIVIEPEAPGGQAGTSSLVRNYLGFPRGISGGELMRNAFRQAWLFQTQFVFSRQAVDLRVGDGERVVVLSNGEEIRSHAVLLAVGIAYRRLGIPHLDALVGAGVYYSTAVSEAQAMRGKRVYVVGAGNSSGQAAMFLSRYARQVTMLARSGSMAASMSDYLVREIRATRSIDVRMHTEVVDARGEQLLEGLLLRNNATGEAEEVDADALFVLIGGEPHTDWLPPAICRDAQGYIVTGRDLADDGRDVDWPLQRAPLPLETSVPGVFAAGDVRHGAAKRIASAVGEGSVAIRYVHEYLAGV